MCPFFQGNRTDRGGHRGPLGVLPFSVRKGVTDFFFFLLRSGRLFPPLSFSPFSVIRVVCCFFSLPPPPQERLFFPPPLPKRARILVVPFSLSGKKPLFWKRSPRRFRWLGSPFLSFSRTSGSVVAFLQKKARREVCGKKSESPPGVASDPVLSNGDGDWWLLFWLSRADFLEKLTSHFFSGGVSHSSPYKGIFYTAGS